MVLPDLKDSEVKKLETLIFDFLWSGKSHKVCKKDCKLPEKEGGLGIIDIKAFWQSLKFSWIRRALNTNAFWPNILIEEVNTVTGLNLNLVEIFQLGPKYLDFLGKKIGNGFWSQVLRIIDPIMQGAIFCIPENISYASIWDNPLILRNKKPIKKHSYLGWSDKINQMSDFYHPNTNRLMTKDEFEHFHLLQIEHQTFIEMAYIFKNARQKIGLVESSKFPVYRPCQPLLIAIANSVKKGCNRYYSLLRRKHFLSSTVVKREEKWHQELGITLSTRFWNNAYRLTSSIKNDNYMKWIQFQINRNSLHTNYIVNKFQVNVSPLCTFCTRAGLVNPGLELITELFYDCSIVTKLWTDIKVWFSSLDIEIPVQRKTILFGLHDQDYTSVPNYVILSGKCFIWRSRTGVIDLSLTNFQRFLFFKLDDMRNSYIYAKNEHKFDQWLIVYECLLRLKNE